MLNNGGGLGRGRSRLVSFIFVFLAIVGISIIWTSILSVQFENFQNVFQQFQNSPLLFSDKDFKNVLVDGSRNSFLQNEIIPEEIKKAMEAQTMRPKSVILQEEIKALENIPIARENAPKVNESLLPFEKKCGARPNILDIEFSNNYWQTMRAWGEGKNETLIFLYSAYLDVRGDKPFVRVISDSYQLLNQSGMAQPQFCQFWYSGIKDPVISKVENVTYMWREAWGKKGNYHPYFINCHLPLFNNSELSGSSSEVGEWLPESVSIVSEKCEKSLNDIQIKFVVPEVKEDFAVCIKALDMANEDFSQRLIEWIEIHWLMGVAKMHFHIFEVHPNMKKVLEYYEKLGRVTVKQFSLPGFQTNLPSMRNNYIYSGSKLTLKRRQELIAYNDCFYNNLYSYQYIAAVDVDEVIMSANLNSWTWLDLIQELNVTNDASICFRMMLFVDKIVKKNTDIVYAVAPNITDQVEGYPYMMNRLNYELKTTCNGGGVRGIKCLHNTDNAIVLHNHAPLACYRSPCHRVITHDIAYAHHHKDSCYKDGHNETLLDQPFGYDPNILKYKDELISARNEVLKQAF